MLRFGTAALILVVLPGFACSGPTVETSPLVQLPPRPDDATVYLFVREEATPGCPWEVVGSVAADAGWLDRESDLKAVEQAVRAMGGQGVLLGAREDPEADVIRFLDPISLCNPLDAPREPGG
jgi:hypothetical protein